MNGVTDADAHIAASAVTQRQQATRRYKRAIAVALADLEKRIAMPGSETRNADFGQHFVGGKIGDVRRLEKSVRCNRARGTRAARNHRRAGQRDDERHLESRIIMAEIAADGAVIADRMIGDVGIRLGHDRAVGRDDRRAKKRVMRRQRADAHLAVLLRRCIATRLSRLTSISRAGAICRRLSMGTRLWPPASTLALLPCRDNASSAARKVGGLS